MKISSSTQEILYTNVCDFLQMMVALRCVSKFIFSKWDELIFSFSPRNDVKIYFTKLNVIYFDLLYFIAFKLPQTTFLAINHEINDLYNYEYSSFSYEEDGSYCNFKRQIVSPLPHYVIMTFSFAKGICTSSLVWRKLNIVFKAWWDIFINNC